MKWIISILAIIVFASCANNKQKKVGQFVYVDCFNTIHIDRECASKLVKDPKTKEERFANMRGIEFVDTCNLTHYKEVGTYSMNEYKFCPRCVDDEAYKHLSEIISRNERQGK